ncbi:MAG: molybdopterin molybdotransferase [Methanofollis sp.]|nr:molybdopterin molybdotransferase [Methanofollis sp.]
MMSLFLKVVSVDEARETIRRIAPTTGSEEIAFEEAVGRALAGPILSAEDIPGFDRSIKDGYAVVAADTATATESVPVALRCVGRIAMGRGKPGSILQGSCAYIPTGAQLPAGADAVVMAEYCEEIGEDVLVKKPVAPGENMLTRDEDYAAGDAIFAPGRVLSPQDIGVLAALGVTRVAVRKKPVIGIISTGIEIVPVESNPGIGEVRDVNTYLCETFAGQEGAVPKKYGTVKDDAQALTALLDRAVADGCDAVFISGGSSKDERDVTAQAVAAVGEVLIHGIALAPGKPTIIGRAGRTAIIGIPGHPAATYVGLTVLGRELIHAMLGVTSFREKKALARLTENVHSEKGREEYLRVRLEDGRAVPLFGKSGLLNTIVQSDGLVCIPAGQEGYEAGDTVEVALW